VRGNSNGLEVKDFRLFFNEWEINPDLTIYIGRDFALVDHSLPKDLRILMKEREANNELNEDKLKRILDEYRSNRTRRVA
ncbi:MAG: DUF460 domain-containing protein, partial [Metallosphaera sp.]